MNIKQSSNLWKRVGEDDPMWAILSDETKRGGKWDTGEFFATGNGHVEKSLKEIRERGVSIPRHRALDFGCGMGRLTQALANHFEQVDGVDISASMIDHARMHNKFGNSVQYHLNCEANLEILGSETFDFIYSHIVLQHIPTRYQLSYIAEFMRLLKPDGVALFQTIHFHGWRALLPDKAVEIYRAIAYRGKTFLPMYEVNSSCVKKLLKDGGGDLVDYSCAPFQEWESRFNSDMYLVVKRVKPAV